MTDADIFHRIRFWLISKLAGKMFVMINVHLIVPNGEPGPLCVRTKINGFMIQNCRIEGCNDVEIRQVPTRGDQ